MIKLFFKCLFKPINIMIIILIIVWYYFRADLMIKNKQLSEDKTQTELLQSINDRIYDMNNLLNKPTIIEYTPNK